MGVKLKDIMLPLRVALTGGVHSPSVFELLIVLGKEETIARISKLL